jgi:hypothetical protein
LSGGTIEKIRPSKIKQVSSTNEMKDKEIKDKWRLVDEGFKKIIEAPVARKKYFHKYLNEFETWLNGVKDKYELTYKNKIRSDAELDEIVTLDLLLAEIETFYKKLRDAAGKGSKLIKSEKKFVHFLK